MNATDMKHHPALSDDDVAALEETPQFVVVDLPDELDALSQVVFGHDRGKSLDV